jgi:hypothetical protein
MQNRWKYINVKIGQASEAKYTEATTNLANKTAARAGMALVVAE